MTTEMKIAFNLLTESYVRLRHLHNEVSQSYHALANIVNSDAHKALSWKDCQEQTCQMNQKMLNDVLIAEKKD